MKVAINRCFGGFGITDAAFEKLLDRKGIAFDKVEKENSAFLGASYYEAGHAGNEEHYLSDYEFYNDRSDPDLIAVIEEMGELANGWAAEIAIIEIPDDVKWHIHEYDGIEHVAEDHRTWS
jgi:arginine/lysine/ornithine decarboxylase